MKSTIGILLCLVAFIIHAQEKLPVLQIEGQKTDQKIKVISGAFAYINDVWASKGLALSQERTQTYFTKDTALIINGKMVCKGYDEFTKHFQQVSQHIQGKFRFPLFEAIGVNNKVVVHFDEDIYDNHGTYYPANVIAIFTFDHDKIQKWEEVVNSPYFRQAAASSVVYSK